MLPVNPGSEHVMSSRSRLAELSALFGLLLGSLGVSLVLGEILIRLVAPQQLIEVRPDVYMPIDTLGWIFRPNQHTTINTGERTVHLFTDQDGFRVARGGRVDRRPRVLLIGDSFMAALQVEYEQSLAGLVEKGLRERLGHPVGVRNAAQPGWDPPQYYLQSRSLLSRDTFDLVVVAFYIGNDVVLHRADYLPPRTPDPRYALRFPTRPTWADLTVSVFRPINDWLKRRSHLFLFVKNHVQTLRMRVGLTAEYFPIEFLRSEATSPRWDVSADICRDIARLAGRRGIPTLFVLIPAPFQIDRAVFQQYNRGFRIDSGAVDLNQPTRLMAERLKARGLNVVDALPAFRAAYKRSAVLYGSIDRHLTPEGHRVLYDFLEPFLAELLAPTAVPNQRLTADH
jgi:hypothetical protein